MNDNILDKKKVTLSSKIFKIISFPFYIVFNIISFIFFGMSLNKFLDLDTTNKKWPMLCIRMIIICSFLIIVLPYILSNFHTIIHTLSTLTTTDILNILNMILVGTLAFAVLSIILFKLLH